MASTETTVSLTFPESTLKGVLRDGKEFVLDPVRKSFVRLTPEEWVRQNALVFLIEKVKVPPGLIGVETSFTFNGMKRRADIVVFDRSARPLIVVECKSPDVRIDQSVFDQVGRYNREIRAPYVVVTNGETHFCLAVNFREQSYRFLPELPDYEELLGSLS